MSHHKHIISATDMSRSLSHVLNTVLYHGDSYEITRGKDVIARIVPAKPHGKSMTAKTFTVFMKNLPSLESDDARDFESSIKKTRRQLPKAKNPWE